MKASRWTGQRGSTAAPNRNPSIAVQYVYSTNTTTTTSSSSSGDAGSKNKKLSGFHRKGFPDSLPEVVRGRATPEEEWTGKVVRIISGGQTGADRAGLEAGKLLGVATGGTAPANFLTENGMCWPNPPNYYLAALLQNWLFIKAQIPHWRSLA